MEATPSRCLCPAGGAAEVASHTPAGACSEHNSGNVGIGTVSPVARMDIVEDDTNPGLGLNYGGNDHCTPPGQVSTPRLSVKLLDYCRSLNLYFHDF